MEPQSRPAYVDVKGRLFDRFQSPGYSSNRKNKQKKPSILSSYRLFMSETDDQRNTEGVEPVEDRENNPSQELETSAPDTSTKSVKKNVSGALLDDLLAATDQAVAAEVEGVKATIRDREQADNQAKEEETKRRRQELSDLRQKEIDRRKSKIRERQRRQALEAMAADNEAVDPDMEVVATPRGKAGPILSVLLLIVIAGGLAWWFLKSPEPKKTVSDSNSVVLENTLSTEAAPPPPPLRDLEMETEPSERRGLESSFAPASIAVEKKRSVRKKRRSVRKRKAKAKKPKAPKRRKTRFKRLRDL